MIDGKKLIDKRKELKMKYCKYWEERPESDTFSGAHGFIEMMLTEAIQYGYEQGESFGKYENYADQVTDKFLIQPENDRAWKKELDDIMKDCSNITCNSNESKTVRLLGLIAEMILYRRS
jgi:hypothetical protein